MSDSIQSSPPEGSPPAPTATSDPVGSAPPATSVATGAQPAPSGDTPAPGTSDPTAASKTSAADLAMDALLAESAAPTTTTPPAAPTAQSQENAAPAATTPPADPPPAAPTEPQATDHEDEEASPAEVQSNLVPLKKLTRALGSRREIKQDLEKTKTELAQERALTDRVLATFNAAGVDAQNLKPFLAALSNARSDEAARQTVARFLGIQAAPAHSTVAQIDVAKMTEALDTYDVAAIRSHLASAGILPTTGTPTTPAPTAPAQPPPAQNQPPTRQADPAAPNVLIQTVATMGQTLRAQYGPQEAKRLADLIDAEARNRITDMESLKVRVDVDSAAEVWKRSLETVIRQEAGRRAAPTQPPAAPPQQAPPIQNTLRPQQTPPPASKPKSADEQFNELAGAGR